MWTVQSDRNACMTSTRAARAAEIVSATQTHSEEQRAHAEREAAEHATRGLRSLEAHLPNSFLDNA
jgi:hypothetical protein